MAEGNPGQQPSDDLEWAPVEIHPRTPNTAIALLHHRHNSGAACGACEILALRESVRELEESAAYLEGALRKITKREGRFSHDQMTHAENVMDDMAEVAAKAIKGEEWDD